MKAIKLSHRSVLTLALLAAPALPLAAHADALLDSGVPPSTTGLQLALDGNDYFAAEFNLAAGQTINTVNAYLLAGLDAPGDTFTVALYAGGDLTSRNPTQLYAAQATYTGDGWNGLTNLGWTPGAAGLYWVAFEVGASDSAIGLSAPTPATAGTVPAVAYAFNAGSGYQTAGATSFGVQVNPVPLPATAWLALSGVVGLLGLSRRRVAV
jgi:hypothetical protein